MFQTNDQFNVLGTGLVASEFHPVSAAIGLDGVAAHFDKLGALIGSRGIKNRREEREAEAREQEKRRKKAGQTQGYLAVPVLPMVAVDIGCAHAGAGFTHAV